LTHTHAGTHSIKKRIISKNISLRVADVTTIDSFCLDWVYAYPVLSNLDVYGVELDWAQIRKAFLNLIENDHIKKIIKLKWKGLILDEYQDCDLDQHNIALKLSKLLPTRIFGDPLQGIFDFNGASFNWDFDVLTNFEQVAFEIIPVRWLTTCPELGDWLLKKRNELISENKVTFQNSPASINLIRTNDYLSMIKISNRIARTNPGESILIINHQAAQCHNTAKSLVGLFKSIEELEFIDLKEFAKAYDATSDDKKFSYIINNLKKFVIGINNNLLNNLDHLKKGKILKNEYYLKNKNVLDDLSQKMLVWDISEIISVLELLTKLQGFKVFRLEAWVLMLEAFKNLSLSNSNTLEEATRSVVNKYRYIGRRPHLRIVARIRLIKGLDFDHVIIYNFQDLKNVKEAYVALTRAKKSITIFADKETFTYSDSNLPNLLN
jgi:DNA helicase-2/ATP-dependent DNA helicase PcrA